ncbi:hypothetical protein HBH42_073960 [Parastagonospora nodorum]|nr:hypothetical protein HBH42_073960 [Parastagonospora nodorum]
MMGKRKGHTVYQVRWQTPVAARRTATEKDVNKYLDDPEEVELKDILSPEMYELYGEDLPTFSKKSAGILPEHSEHDHEIRLKPGAEAPNHRMRPQSGRHDEAIRKYIVEMEKCGFIAKTNSAARSNITIVAKPDGGIRVCVDYRDLNDVTIKDRYPIPFFRETLARLNNATIFSKFDVIHAFHRIRMKPGSEWLTAFSTRLGTYEYRVMPFGLCNAPATFQRAINSALFDHLDDFCTAYLDDVLVYSKTVKEHIQHCKSVLRRLRAQGFYVDPKKTELHQTKVKFLGMFVTNAGVEMDPDKIAAINEWRMPTTATEVLAFLGYTGFYRRFIKNYSAIALPLTKLVKARIEERPSKNPTKPVIRKTCYEKFEVTDEHRQAFKALQDAFRPDIVLRHFDPEKPVRVYTDASAWATGGVMKQENDNGDWQPIGFFSKKHSPAECNYDIYDLELMGIIRAFEEWEPELIGTPHQISVITDHRNLETFMATKKLNRRQARWSLFLSQFDFKIAYAPGNTNVEADALSRRPQDVPEDATDERITNNDVIVLGPKVLAPGVQPAIQTALRAMSTSHRKKPDWVSPEQRRVLKFCLMASDYDDLDPEEFEDEPAQDWINGTVDSSLPSYDEDTRPTAELLNAAYKDDPIALAAFTAIDSGATKLPNSFHKKGHFFSRADITSSGEGPERRLFIDQTRLYIPPDARLQRRIFELCHDHEIAGHKGPRGTFYLMFERYYWPKMAQSIKKFCTACGVCSRTKSPRDGKHGYLRSLPIPNARWTDLSVDYIQDLPPSQYLGFQYRNILVIGCRLTKRRHFFPTVTRDPIEAARCFMEVFKNHGLPLNIVSDRGTTFTCEFWKRICARLKIKQKLSTSYHPETDGQTERYNQSLETYLRQFVNFTQDDWASFLHIAEFQANDTVNVSIGMTPFMADLGYHPRSGIHPGEEATAELSKRLQSQQVRADELINANADLVAHLKEQIRWAQQEQQAHANTSRHGGPAYKIGDRVWLSTANWSTSRPTKKFEDRWAGPYTVTRIIHDGRAYHLDLPEEMIRHGVFPVFHPRLLRPADAEPLPDQALPQPKEISIVDPDGSEHSEWYVDAVVDCKQRKSAPHKGQWCYRVKWTNDPLPTWEPAAEFGENYDAFLYHYKHPERPKPPHFRFPRDWQPYPEDQELTVGQPGEPGDEDR